MLAVLAVCAVALSAVAVATVQTLVDRLGGNVPRVPDAFSGLDPSTRPVAAGGLTFLLVGVDTRTDDPAAGTDASAPDGSRSDVLLVARLFEGGTGAAVASIPRDAWVDVPGHGMEKINKAYAFGGPSLLIRTVENLTALHIDHFAKIDFAGFRSVVDSVGGIDVGLAAATSNQGVRFRPGTNHLDGAAALAYVRQRHGLADVDLDRAQRQLNALRAVLTKVAATGALDDPIGLYRLLDSLGEFVSVDDTLSNSELRGVPLDNISFVHAPVAGPGREGEQSVVHLEAGRCGELWDSLRRGTTAAYVEEHTNDSLGPVTR
jgi:LCP family protein required for cell wall assembly